MKARITKLFNLLQNTVFGIVFCISILLLIRFFACDIYYVPSSSMDSTIHSGETILTNKLAYGSRWFTDNGVIRIPGYSSVQRNDIVVFNFPQGDTVFVDTPLINYYTESTKHSLNIKHAEAKNKATTYLSIQNRVAYVKRCIGIPRDTITLKNGIVYCNNTLLEDSKNCNYRYRIKGKPETIPNYLKAHRIYYFWQTGQSDSLYAFNTRASIAAKMNTGDYQVYRFPSNWYEKNIFRITQAKKKDSWKYDTYGPLYIPAQGDTLKINLQNLELYNRLITVYEGNKIQVSENEIFINNHPTKEYIVQQDYYFMMGDNRNGSIDSRTWGFVPKDHIIGKAQIVVNSQRHEETRWNRIGTLLE